ncbi:MAG: phosphatase PAP2 family protein [Clostridia bacterium]|nr:phosphatase PAP2 family protein [Clostridia bacterium]
MELIQSHIGGFGTSIASLCSAFGEEFLMVAVLGLLYWCLDKKWGKYLAANVLVGVTYTSMLKNVVLRRRPYFDNPSVKCLKPLEKDADLYDIAAQGYSFPSTHSTNAVTTYASLAVYKKGKVLSIISVVIILFVGISRFSLGVHYPTDVMVGWLCGVLIIYLIPFIHSKISKDWVFYLILVVLALPGIFFCNSNDYYSGLGLMIGVFGGFVFEER